MNSSFTFFILIALIGLAVILFLMKDSKKNILNDQNKFNGKSDRQLMEFLIDLNIKKEKHLNRIDGMLLFFTVMAILGMAFYFFTILFL